jgi:DNA-directed RNA polymerase specialized sigma24 family protein
MHNKNLSVPQSVQESYVLQALADVRKLVFYKLTSAHKDSAEDLLQRIFCKIWLWKTRHNKVLDYEDWRKVTKTIADREIGAYFADKYTKVVLFSQMEADFWDGFSMAVSFKNNLEGNTRAEIDSLLLSIWRASQILTLRQKYSFILHSENFLIEFINTGFCSLEELAVYFEVSNEIFSDIMNFIPLSDRQIGELLEAKLNESVTSQQIWEARAKAKARLLRQMKQPTK